MPKAAKKSTSETQNMPPEDTDVPKSPEESASSDQEPDAEVSFHPSLVPPTHPMPQVLPSIKCLTLKAQKWIGLLMMGYITAFSSGD